jgi:hypothetical protein
VETKQAVYKKLSIVELKLEDIDLVMPMTMGLIVSGTWLDLLRLKHYLDKLEDFMVVYNTITTTHLRIVAVNEYEEFLEYKKQMKIEKETRLRK